MRRATLRKLFALDEPVTLRKLCNPLFIIRLLHRMRYLYYAIIGVVGILINLALTWAFTTFVFGLEGYFYGYLIGLAGNIIFNFTLHSIITFKTRKRHAKRFLIFVAYSMLAAVIQAASVKTITDAVGARHYLFVITGVIIVISTINFVISRIFIFYEPEKGKRI